MISAAKFLENAPIEDPGYFIRAAARNINDAQVATRCAEIGEPITLGYMPCLNVVTDFVDIKKDAFRAMTREQLILCASLVALASNPDVYRM